MTRILNQAMAQGLPGRMLESYMRFTGDIMVLKNFEKELTVHLWYKSFGGTGLGTTALYMSVGGSISTGESRVQPALSQKLIEFESAGFVFSNFMTSK